MNGWNEGFLRRLQNAGGLVRLELLEIKAQDGVSRLIYRAKFEHESMLLNLVSNQSRKISALKLAAE